MWIVSGKSLGLYYDRWDGLVSVNCLRCIDDVYSPGFNEADVAGIKRNTWEITLHVVDILGVVFICTVNSELFRINVMRPALNVAAKQVGRDIYTGVIFGIVY